MLLCCAGRNPLKKFRDAHKIQGSPCHPSALARACSGRGWHRARHERLRPEREEVRGASPYAAIENEPALKLIVHSPLPEALAQGVVQIQYRVENVHIVPAFGAGALNVSPRAGHLHVHVDLPWWWADGSGLN